MTTLKKLFVAGGMVLASGVIAEARGAQEQSHVIARPAACECPAETETPCIINQAWQRANEQAEQAAEQRHADQIRRERERREMDAIDAIQADLDARLAEIRRGDVAPAAPSATERAQQRERDRQARERQIQEARAQQVTRAAREPRQSDNQLSIFTGISRDTVNGQTNLSGGVQYGHNYIGAQSPVSMNVGDLVDGLSEASKSFIFGQLSNGTIGVDGVMNFDASHVAGGVTLSGQNINSNSGDLYRDAVLNEVLGRLSMRLGLSSTEIAEINDRWKRLELSFGVQTNIPNSPDNQLGLMLLKDLFPAQIILRNNIAEAATFRDLLDFERAGFASTTFTIEPDTTRQMVFNNTGSNFLANIIPNFHLSTGPDGSGNGWEVTNWGATWSFTPGVTNRQQSANLSRVQQFGSDDSMRVGR